MRESTSSWIGHFEEKIDLSHIYLAVVLRGAISITILCLKNSPLQDLLEVLCNFLEIDFISKTKMAHVESAIYVHDLFCNFKICT